MELTSTVEASTASFEVWNITQNNSGSQIHSHGSYSGSTSTFYISMFLIWVPGTLTNVLAMTFIIRDMRKAIFPAIVLLFTLCMCDLCSVVVSWIHHIMLRYMTMTFPTCATTSFLQSVFNVASSITNSFMAVDRVLAICYPFYYKQHLESNTWKRALVIAGVSVVGYSLFPLIGLGGVISTRRGVAFCDLFSYRDAPRQQVYGILYGIIGVASILVITTCNAVLIRALFRMNHRIGAMDMSLSTDQTGDSTSAKRATSFEVAFAKLMMGLAAVYLLCAAPLQILVLLQSCNVKIGPATIGYIHLISGFVYTANPTVYILARKTNLKKVKELLCKCCER